MVGEVRGKEAFDMIQAFNTGNSGSMSTGHANSSKDMLTRLETMILMGGDLPIPAIRGQIFAAIDIIIHLGRMRDKTRKVLEISELVEFDGNHITLNPIFSFKESDNSSSIVNGCLEYTGHPLTHKDKLYSAGFKEPSYE